MCLLAPATQVQEPVSIWSRVFIGAAQNECVCVWQHLFQQSDWIHRHISRCKYYRRWQVFVLLVIAFRHCYYDPSLFGQTMFSHMVVTSTSFAAWNCVCPPLQDPSCVIWWGTGHWFQSDWSFVGRLESCTNMQAKGTVWTPFHDADASVYNSFKRLLWHKPKLKIIIFIVDQSAGKQVKLEKQKISPSVWLC